MHWLVLYQDAGELPWVGWVACCCQIAHTSQMTHLPNTLLSYIPLVGNWPIQVMEVSGRLPFTCTVSDIHTISASTYFAPDNTNPPCLYLPLYNCSQAKVFCFLVQDYYKIIEKWMPKYGNIHKKVCCNSK